MGRRTFDHFMVHVGIGGNRKLRRRLTIEERWCYVAGVLAIAAESPIRGRLLIAGSKADEHDVADTAGVPVKVARSTLAKLRDLEMLMPDDELDCERVHDFEEHNPAPKSDKTAAERMRRYRKRLRRDASSDGTGNGIVTPLVTPSVTEGVTPPEVEEEVEDPRNPRDRGSASDDLGWAEWLAHHCQITGYEPPAEKTKAYKAMVALYRQRRQEDYSLADLKFASLGAWNDDHRRENGYTTPDSILRPMKVYGLIQRGKASRGSKRRQVVDDTEERLKAARR